MSNDQILKEVAVRLDNRVKLKGILEMFDGVVFEQLLLGGYRALHRKQPELATQMIEFAKEFLEVDKPGMVDEAADCLGEIFKLIFKA